MTNPKQQLLEFRGIPLPHLATYLSECGGVSNSTALPLFFAGDGWSAAILEEKEVEITSRFRVNAVFIQFSAESEEQLADLLNRFRKKTRRVGG